MGGEALALARNARSGKPLSVSLRVNVQTSVKAFVHWLADRPGYKSLISHSIADYFGPSMKDARIARDRRPIPYPSEAQILHAFRLMPHVTDIDRRNRALLALLNLTGARIGAIASLMLGHIDLEDGCVNQDGRSVNTKFGKSFTTWFLPIDPMFIECLSDWINELRDLHLFSATDPLFPRPEMRVSSAKGFQFIGLSRKHYSGDESLRKIVKNAFTPPCQGSCPLLYFYSISQVGGIGR